MSEETTMTETRTLREIIDQTPYEEPVPWARAAEFAAGRLGVALAGRIVWATPTAPTFDQLGTLTGSDTSLTLRFEESEPSCVLLQVQVPCPTDPECDGPAWDTIEESGGLLNALDGDPEDPQCEVCG